MVSKQNEEVVLSRLVRLFRQSPLMYLSESNIWTYRGDESLKLTLVDVVSDHQNFVDRAETILVAKQFELPQSFFPLAFTGWHDVDLAFLLPTLIADLEKREKRSKSYEIRQTGLLVKEGVLLVRLLSLFERQFQQLRGISICFVSKRKG